MLFAMLGHALVMGLATMEIVFVIASILVNSVKTKVTMDVLIPPCVVHFT